MQTCFASMLNFFNMMQLKQYVPQELTYNNADENVC